MILDIILLTLSSEIFFTSSLLQREKTYLTCDSSLSIKLYLARVISDFTVES